MRNTTFKNSFIGYAIAGILCGSLWLSGCAPVLRKDHGLHVLGDYAPGSDSRKVVITTRDPARIAEIARKDPEWDVRRAAVQNFRSGNAFFNCALDPATEVRVAAVEKLTDLRRYGQ